MHDDLHDDAISERGASEVGRAGRPPVLRRALLVAALAIPLLGAGIGTTVAASAAPATGASTPADAVQQLLAAADHSDLLAALAVLRPAEREAIVPGLSNLVNELRRLGILSSSASLGHVDGLGLGFSDVRTATFAYGPRLVAVRLTGGTVRSAENSGELPIGSFLRAHLGPLSPATRTSSSSAETGRSVIATVESNGRWYVSLGYTIAIDELRAEGRYGAPPAKGVAPTGGTTPQGVVTDFLDSLAALDLRGMIADLSPGEMGALQSYAPVFLPRAEHALATTRQPVQVMISNERYTTRAVSSGTLVEVASLDYSATIGATKISYADGCTTTTINGTTTTQCGTSSSSPDLATLPAKLRTVVRQLEPLMQRLARHRPEVGFVTTEESGRYYLSPAGTMLADLNGVLTDVEPGDLGTFVEVWHELKGLVRSATPSQGTSALRGLD